MHKIRSLVRYAFAVALPFVISGAAPSSSPSDLHGIMITEEQHSAETKLTGTAHLRMQAHVTGEGPPLVLVGGGLTGWKSWEPHTEMLAAKRTVARLQLLAVQYGLETRPLPEGYAARMESGAMLAALDSLGWQDPVDVVAWSYGALITLDFALNHPERVRTLTLIEPPAAWVLPEKGLHDPDVQALLGLEIGEDVGERDLEAFVRAAALVPPGIVPQELPQWPVWMEHRRSLRAVNETLKHDDDPSRLSAFGRPVLLVSGTGTTPFLRQIHDTLAGLLPNARTREMPAGHAPHIVSMESFLAEVEGFWAGAAR